MIAFIISSHCTPKQIKDIVGKSVWKKIVHNSFTLNSIISRGINNVNQIENIKYRVDISPSILDRDMPWSEETATFTKIVNKFCKEQRILTKWSKVYEVINIVRDTIDLS